MTGTDRLGFVAVAVLLAGAFVAGRCSAPPVAGPSRDSTAIMALADTIGALRARLGTQSDTARAELAAADTAAAAGSASLARGDSLRGRLPAPAPLPADADTAQLVTYLKSRETYLENQLATEKARAAEYRKSATDFRRANDGSTRAASRWFSGYMTCDSKLREIQDTLPRIAAHIGELEGQLRRQRNGVRVGLAVDGVAAGDGWAVLAGPVVAARRTALGIEAEASLTGGLGMGGKIGEIPATGPGVALRVGVTF